MATKKITKEETNLDIISNSYVKNINSLRAFVKNLAPSAGEYDKEVMEKIDNTFKKIFEIAGKEGIAIGKDKTIQFEVRTISEAKQISYLLRRIPPLPSAQTKLLYKSSFVMLVCYFDFLMSDLIHYYYRKYPQSISEKEMSITLSELELCKDINEAIDNVIQKRIDAIMYGNLQTQKDFFKKGLKTDIKEDLINWAVINEAIERRNIIVHNDSRINRRYLQNVDLSCVAESTRGFKEGKQIHIKDDYFNNLCDEFYITGIILIQNCWRKWNKGEVDKADTKLINILYDLLVEENWSVAERLGLYSKECKTCNTANRLYLDVNYCQSLKWQGKTDKLEEELKGFDTSSLSPKYMLALCALKSDRDGFYENVEKSVVADNMERVDFMEWPLFRELRKEKAYKNKIDKMLSQIPNEVRKDSDTKTHNID